MENEAFQMKGRSANQSNSSNNRKKGGKCKCIVIVILAILLLAFIIALIATVATDARTKEKQKQDIKDLNAKLAKERNSSSSAALIKLKMENARLNETLKNKTSELSKATSEKATLTIELNQAKKVGDLQKNNSALNKLKMDVSRLNETLKNKTSELSKARSEKAALTMELNQAKAKVGELQKNNSALNRLKMENARLNETLKNKTSELSKATTEKATLTTELNKARKVGELLKNNSESKIKMKSCNGATFDDIPESLRNSTGGEIVQEIPGTFQFIKSYCDVTADGGNWTVFQRRMDGSVDFLLNWANYVTGFGSLRGEFWLGLEALHQLTKNGDQELRIDMIERSTGIHYYAKYSTFKVGPASDNYRLTVNGYSGNATNAFKDPKNLWGSQNNQQFTTKDRDNDKQATRNCAVQWKSGGWWFNKCFRANLNGKYSGTSNNGILWTNLNGGRGMNMRFTEMKFRRKN